MNVSDYWVNGARHGQYALTEDLIPTVRRIGALTHNKTLNTDDRRLTG